MAEFSNSFNACNSALIHLLSDPFIGDFGRVGLP